MLHVYTAYDASSLHLSAPEYSCSPTKDTGTVTLDLSTTRMKPWWPLNFLNKPCIEFHTSLPSQTLKNVTSLNFRAHKLRPPTGLSHHLESFPLKSLCPKQHSFPGLLNLSYFHHTFLYIGLLKILSSLICLLCLDCFLVLSLLCRATCFDRLYNLPTDILNVFIKLSVHPSSSLRYIHSSHQSLKLCFSPSS